MSTSTSGTPDVAMADTVDGRSEADKSTGRETASADIESRANSHVIDVDHAESTTSSSKTKLTASLANGTDDRDLQSQLNGEISQHSARTGDQDAGKATKSTSSSATPDDGAGDRNGHSQGSHEPPNDSQTSVVTERSQDLGSAAPQSTQASIEQDGLKKVGAVSSTDATTNGHDPENVLSSVERGSKALSATPGVERQLLPAGSQHSAAQPTLLPAEKPVSSRKAANEQMQEDVAALKAILNTFSAEVAQKVLRENWRTFLFERYDLDHISFVLRAGLKNSNAFVWEKLIKDENIFKEPLVEAVSSKLQVRKQVLSRTGASDIINHVPESALDEALAYKIRTMPAQKLINWLAEGNRLGFSSDDILEEDESVTPNMLSRPPSRSNLDNRHPRDAPVEGYRPAPNQPGLAVADRDPLLAEQERNAAIAAAAHPRAPPSDGVLRCNACYVTFNHFSGYNYHVTKSVCQKKRPAEPYKWFCDNCLQGFTTKQGKEYHAMNRVCRADGVEPATALAKAHQQNTPYNPPPPQPYVRTNSNDTRPVAQTPSTTTLPPISSIPAHSGHGSQAPTQTWSVDSRRQLPPVPQRTNSNGVPAVGGPSQPHSAYVPQNVVSHHTSHSHHMPRPPQSHFEIAIPSPSKPRPERQEAQAVAIAPQHSRTPRPAFRRQTPSADIRTSPSDLPPEKLKELERQLAEADRRYEQGQAAIPDSYTEAERQTKLTGLKNANASRKSQIRKAFGVTLRMREKDKLAKRAVLNASPAVRSGYVPQRVESPHGSPSTIPPQGPPHTGFSPINHRPRKPSSEGYQSLYSAPRPSNSTHNHQGPPAPPRNVASPLSVPTGPPGTHLIMTTQMFTPKQYQGPPPKQNVNKRAHESTEHEYRPRSSRATDGEGSGAGTGGEESTPPSPKEANAGHGRRSNTREEAIAIEDSSSESGGASK